MEEKIDFKGVYSVYDEVSGLFGVPCIFPCDAVGKRSYLDLTRDSRSILAAHPADFSLRKIGFFDEHSGKIDSIEPLVIVSAKETESFASAVQAAGQGAAVGDAIPLKPQSDQEEDSQNEVL